MGSNLHIYVEYYNNKLNSNIFYYLFIILKFLQYYGDVFMFKKKKILLTFLLALVMTVNISGGTAMAKDTKAKETKE